MEGEPARRSVFRSRISDHSCRKERCAFRWAPSGSGGSLAGESTSLVSSRLWDFLCGQVRQRKPARPQPELLGGMGWLQILDSREGGTYRTFDCVVAYQ